ncbi:hypothetical protein J2751_000924 [Halorubrum alkaliphilum]|uniref:Uncharacterized protein n=1 Tax=Halorubrum alkaliphilum TaxID=261290 RepID=A0A8T4GDV8_9EURY|nr:DUF6498-containing protein [Halorubrum alkaliphilum]MBP1921927.1 hypothetical protein [Halorubrum alkaliphilum]
MFDPRSDPTLGAVLAGNAAALAGVVLFGFDLHTLLVVYWIETGVIGASIAAKIRRSEATDDPNELPDWEYSPMGGGSRSVRELAGASNRTVLGQFLGTYAVFWTLLGAIVISIPDDVAGIDPGSPLVVVAATVGLAATHVVSYRVEYLGRREYERTGPVALMIAPFDHLLVLFVTVWLGSIPVRLFGEPVGALVVMVLAKTYADVRAHGHGGTNGSGPEEKAA